MCVRVSRCVAALILAACLPSSRADVPNAIPLQLMLKDAAGRPITNPAQPISLFIYDVETGGAAIGGELKTVAVTNGLCATSLGRAGLSFDAPYWVGVRIGADPEMTPRIPLRAAPYAFNVRNGAIDHNKLATDFGSLTAASGGRMWYDEIAFTDQVNAVGEAAAPVPAWQSFTPSLTGYLRAVHLAVGSQTGSTITGTLRVYQGEGTGGTVLTSQSVTITTGTAEKIFWMTDPPHLAAGSRYTLYITSPSSALMRISPANVYADGRSGNNAAYDYVFRTFMNPHYSNGRMQVSTNTELANGLQVYSPFYHGIVAITTRPGHSGIYASDGGAAGAYAATFDGDVLALHNLSVSGTLTKGAGSFKIDHPLDPANKTLSHSFVESPDMMNIYNGNVTTDKRGRAVVKLPVWFGALNKDFRYQLTPIGTFADAIIEKEVTNNRFTIRTSRPGVKVSWQVTGIRNDAYAKAHRIKTEEQKPKEARGTYLFPDGFEKAQLASTP